MFDAWFPAGRGRTPKLDRVTRMPTDVRAARIGVPRTSATSASSKRQIDDGGVA
jgi:hypothetical protein